MSVGLRLLSQATEVDRSDWVSMSYLGGSFELLARRLAARGQSEGYQAALAQAARLLGAAVAGREAWRARGEGAGDYPQAALAQPPTLLYRSLGQVLLWGGREAEAREVYAAGVGAGVGWVTPWARPNVPHPLALSPPHPLFEAAEWPSLRPTLAALEAALPAAREEWLALAAARSGSGACGEAGGAACVEGGGGPPALTPESAGLQADVGWSFLTLTVDGAPRGRGCLALPRTCAALADAPLAAFVRDGSARLSVLAAGAHIKPHAGPSNARLRVHCTLQLLWGGPASAALQVGPPGSPPRAWRGDAGEACFAFDESFEHSVSTASAEEVSAAEQAARAVDARVAGMAPLGSERVVLLIDIANPFLAEREDWRKEALRDGWNAQPSVAAQLDETWLEAQADARRWGGRDAVTAREL